MLFRSISLITYGELTYGAFKSQAQQKSLQLMTNFLEDLKISILPLNQDIMLRYGKLKAELETLFRRYEEIRFYPANPVEFGAGAIEVYRLQNSR